MSLRARLATAGDDGRIRALLRELPMPGSMSLAFTREPSFFAALRAEGRAPRVCVVEDGDRLIGFGAATLKPVYLNGRPAQVGYLSTLRMRPEGRATGALLRGYRFFADLDRTGPVVPFHLTCIIEENARAREILTGRPRAGMPEYRELGRLRTEVLAVPRRPRARRRGALPTVPGRKVGAGPIFDFLREHGPSRQFYPVYSTEDLSGPDGLLPGLTMGDFDAVVEDGRIAGVMACWDQSAIRQSVVAGYTGWLGWAARLSRAAAPLLPVPALPRAGEVVPAVYAACVAVDRERPEVFGALVDGALSRLASAGKSFLLVGLPEGDPLAPALDGRPRIVLRSRYYAVRWGGEAPVALDARPPYLELGSL